MRRLSFIIALSFFSVLTFAQSPHGINFKYDCSSCHNSNNWKVVHQDLKFDHQQTKFPLIGQHRYTDCKECHISLEFSKAKENCSNCHKDVHKNSVSTNCSKCHTPTTWLVLQVDQLHEQSRFPLIGNHRNQSCQLCHTKYTELNFEPLGIACYDCHAKDYLSSQRPNHTAANFSKDCLTCHKMTDSKWNITGVNHDFFPLIGGHNVANCFSCHKNNTLTKVSNDCYSCHQNHFSQSINPNHVMGNFPTTCNLCHSSNSWKPSTFDHTRTSFPLIGQHSIATCMSCHTTGFTGTKTDCYSCHKSNYDATKNPNHKAINFQTTCVDCHTPSGWTPATFDHDGKFFPIYSGAHKGKWNVCSDCHTTSSNYANFSCITCHEHNQQQMDSDHKSVNGYVYLNSSCYSCHINGSKNGAFNHNTTTFPLTGNHIGLNCESCHKSSTTPPSANCYSCHSTKFSSTTNPNHTSIGISTDCKSCHNTNGWIPSTFNHANTIFVLSGVHLTTSCSSCHQGKTTGTSALCYSCHQVKYNSVIDPNHITGKFSTSCEQCHTTAAWKPATFNHALTVFPLTGKHTTIVCIQCHANGYANTPTDCNSCHSAKFVSTTNPNHTSMGISTNCKSCHNTNGWTPSTFNHSSTAFILSGKHLTAGCELCHKGKTIGTSQVCYDCHSSKFASTVNPNHISIGIPTDCKSCHNTNGWTPSSFNHSNTAFVLSGVHLTTSCSSCHQGKTTGTSALCFSCHQTKYNSVVDPNHVTGKFPTTCEQCHTSAAWKPAIFNHANTIFPLTGKHTTIVCIQCHANGYANTPTDCNSCHSAKFVSTTNPNHTSMGISTNCKSCHNTNGWTPSTFNHSSTAFILSGKHLTAGCELCHKGKTIGTSQVCYDCHSSKFASTVNPNHISIGIPTDCKSCHNTNGWTPSSFNHSNTAFVLSGVHLTTSCSSCHQGKTTGTSALCFSCHQTKYNSVVDPNHVTGKFPTTCEQCHTSAAWKPAIFNHANTIFPLTGKHTTVACIQCHANGYTNTPTDCNSCHSAKFASTINPNHTLIGVSTDCKSCHNTNGWTPSTFNHSSTAFVLSGVHLTTSCSSCHQGKTTGTSTLCYSCHQANYNSVADPNHVTGKFPTTCEQCHTTTAWKPVTFNHALTVFPLTGKHTTVACIQCHANGYTNTPTDCNSCHSAKFASTINPNHTLIGVSTDCKSCHNTNGWTPSTFNHSSTAFVLSGVHLTTSCSSCHQGKTTGTSTLCYSCHQANYNSVADPNHVTGKFPTTCEQCHTTTAWKPVTFNHALTVFPLTGKHTTVACIQCHANGYTNTPTDCNSCHSAKFASTINPNHTLIGVSTDCKSCHNTNGWTPSTFNHSNTTFVLSGAHINTACSSCHQGKTTGTSTLCYSCHQTKYISVVDPNHVTGKFPTTCEQCHTTTTWKPATFNHALTVFPLTGKHTTVACIQCHANGYTNTPTDCNSCHSAKFASTTNPNHTLIGVSTDCKSCHNTNGWTPSTFNHANTIFVLSGAHLTTSCSSCHQGKTTGTSTLCFSCHQTKYNSVIDPNHVTGKFPTTCEQCHTTTAWKPATFNHALTVFPLTGKHTTVACVQCHANGYTNTQTDCNSCHSAKFASTINPNHTSIGISTDCKNCHNTSGWTPSTFNHSSTAFVLSGQHINTSCSSCHKGKTTGTSQVCYDCHSLSYDQSLNPKHKTIGISTDCKSCHNSSAWIPSTFSHSRTAFILTGAHLNAACESCHQGKTTGTSTLCYSCHQTKYNSVVDPNHVTGKFPTTCEQCHTTTAWKPATFNHALTVFPLTGKHTTVACIQCHATGYANTPTDCYSCHKTNYNNSTNPNHATAQFPTTCADCHTTNGWTPSTFNHDANYFRIYSGAHRGRWTLCSNCHNVPSNYKQFTCTTSCHPKAQMDSEHRNRSGYQYESNACFSCHPRV